MEQIKFSLIPHILKLRQMVLDSDSMTDDEKSLAIDDLDDLHETIAYAS